MPKSSLSKESKLGLKDKKILFELDFDARQSNSELAKKVGLSKQGVDYRIKQLIKKGVIEGFYPILNLIQLGYIYGRFFLKLQNLTREKEKELYAQILADKRFKWVLSAEGNYELLVANWASSLTEFKAVSESMIENFGEVIKEKKESIGIKIMHFQSRWLLNTLQTKEVAVAESTKADVEAEVDETDKLLLKALCADARISLVGLARNAAVSPKVAAYRLKRLQKEGIILGYRPSINHNLLGFTHYKILFYLANVTETELRRFKAYLKQLPQVIYLVEEIGICDVDVEVMLPSTQSLFSFIDKIKFDFPTLIKDYQLLIIKKTLKIDYLPFD